VKLVLCENELASKESAPGLGSFFGVLRKVSGLYGQTVFGFGKYKYFTFSPAAATRDDARRARRASARNEASNAILRAFD
jgi:hypothetical protein